MAMNLEELLGWTPPDDEIEPYENLVKVLDEYYPTDWRSWEIINVPYELLFGETISPDTECKLRFAVPTVDLVKCFDKKASSVSERKFKYIKRKLLNWPLGRAIIYAPHAVMEKIHKGEFYIKFMDTVKKLKSRLIPRADASIIMNEEGGEPSTPSSTRSRSRPWEDIAEHPPPKIAKREDQLMQMVQKQNEMFSQLILLQTKQCEGIDDLKQTLIGQDPSVTEKLNESFDSVTSTQEDDAPPLEDLSSHQRTGSCENSLTWHAPNFNVEEPSTSLGEELFNFDPHTIETEPKIAPASLAMTKQGIECQKLDSQGWCNIKYADVQKQFQATPVFASLKVNSHLASVTPPWQHVSTLEKMDLCLGAISHGLLKQRQQFQEIYDKSPSESKTFISRNFLGPESTFRKTSDALLQYVCGRRAETIQHRRAIYKAHNNYLNELLHNIPPSTTHLFAEPSLSELIKEQGGVNKFFLGTSKRYASKQYHQKGRTTAAPTQKPTFQGKRQQARDQQKYKLQPQPVRPRYKKPETKKNFPANSAKGQNRN